MPFTPGFDIEEAKTLIAMIAEMEGPTPPLDDPPFPVDWTIIHDSKSFGPFDNRWQLGANKNNPSQFAILIRGTVNQAGSIIADLLAVMIHANGAMDFKLDSGQFSFSYQFTDVENDRAGVHLGFALAALIIMYDPWHGIIPELLKLTQSGKIPPNSDIYISGHSQGAAVATLCRSLLNYPGNYCVQALPPLNYKTYLFAQPKPGDDFYGNGFNRMAFNQGMAFVINNNQDWVPQVPFTLQAFNDLNTPNPLSILENRLISWFTRIIHGLVLTVRKQIHIPNNLSKAQRVAEYFQHEQFQAMVFGEQNSGLRGKDIRGLELLSLPKILWTLNFVNCGVPFTLWGMPGTNPDKPDDFFWQHHAAMYYDLLAGNPVPKNELIKWTTSSLRYSPR